MTGRAGAGRYREVPDWFTLGLMLASYAGRIAAATAKLLSTVSSLDDVAMAAPSLLPGWDRAMVVTHLARNADAIARCAQAAARGRVVEMYPGGRAARDAAVEAGRGRPAVELEADLRTACRGLADVLDAAGEAIWDARAVTMAGEVQLGPGLVVGRLREGEVHHVDLDCGYRPEDWPFGWVLEEMDRAMLGLPARLPPDVAVVITATDADQHWLAGSGDAMEVTGPLAQVFAWVAGRATSVAGRECPVLGPWR